MAARLLPALRMTEDDEDVCVMQQLAPGNIVGVHNYCDGWCDRCGFANRCVINMSRPRERLAAAEDSLIDHLKERFDQVRTLVARRSTFSVEELLKNMGDIDGDDHGEFDREQARREERLKHDPILREAEAYSN
jgi:hypothetical protein